MALSTMTVVEPSFADPLAIVEVIARRSGMDAQRVDDLELHVSLTGSWRDVVLWFAWRLESQVVQVAAPLEMRVTEKHEAEILKLLAMVNERLWLGHFDLWDEDRGLIYRNSAILPEGQCLDDSQAEIILRGALDAFERFYPAFNFVIWADKTAQEAFDAAICETAGTA